MADLRLISVPLDKTSIASVEKLKHIIAKSNLASCFMFPIPDLKVSFFGPEWTLRDPQTMTKNKCRHKDQSWTITTFSCFVKLQTYVS